MELRKVSDGIWTNGVHRFFESICSECNKVFLRRIDRKNQKFCTESCYWMHKEKQNHICLTEDDYDIVDGLLLSDGCITKPKSGKNYYFTVTSAEKEFISFIDESLMFDMRWSTVKPAPVVIHGKHIGEGSGGYELRTCVSDTFTDMRKKWYPFEKKIVPLDLKITPQKVLVWYLGDGTLDNRHGVVFCTDAFNKDSIEFLRFLLKPIGEADVIGRNRILIPNKYVYEFFEYIGKTSPVECYAHKWDTIVKQSYFGRICGCCKQKFDTDVNHKFACSNKCYQKLWWDKQSYLKIKDSI